MRTKKKKKNSSEQKKTGKSKAKKKKTDWHIFGRPILFYWIFCTVDNENYNKIFEKKKKIFFLQY